MAIIASLLVAVKADTKGFKKGMDKAVKDLNHFKVTAKGMAFIAGGAVVSALSAIATGAVAAGAALTYLTTKGMETTDALAKMSDQLGMAPDQLRGLEFAGGLSGVSDIGNVMKFMEKSISEAATETSAAAKAFDKLALSQEEIKSLAPEEQFFTIIDALRGVESQSDKTALAMDLFGRGGAEVLRLVRDGSEGIKASMAESMEIFGKHSREQLVGVEAASDAVFKLKETWKSLGENLAILVSPAIQSIADLIAEAVKKAGGMEAVAQKIWRIFRDIVAEAKNMYHYMVGLAQLTHVFTRGAAFENLEKWWTGSAGNEVLDWFGDVELAAAETRKIAEETRKLGDEEAKRALELRKQTQEFNKLLQAQEEMDFSEMVAGMNEFIGVQIRAMEETEKLHEGLKNLWTSPTDNIAEQMDGLTKLLNAGKIGIDQWESGMNALEEQSRKNIKPAAQDTKSPFRQFVDGLLESFKTPAQKIQDEIDRLLEPSGQGEFGPGEFGTILKGLRDRIAETLGGETGVAQRIFGEASDWRLSAPGGAVSVDEKQLAAQKEMKMVLERIEAIMGGGLAIKL